MGAAGGVGGFVTQLVADQGARVIGVAREVNADYIRGLGAYETIDYTTNDVVDLVKSAHPEGIAAIIDTVSDAERLATLAEVVRAGGHIEGSWC